MILPAAFESQMQSLLNEDYLDFINALNLKRNTSVHLNNKKTEHELKLHNKIPWANHCYNLEQRPNFTIDPYFHAGHYYVQEASSMMLSSILQEINISSDAMILDLCAAPGGKSLICLNHIHQDGFLHAHDTTGTRAEILRQNIEKWGSDNCIVTTGSTHKLLQTGIQYDVVILDAPCSGEGMFRKESAALTQWNQNKINHCVLLQTELLAQAKKLCKPGGYIIYSTCTYNILENENITASLDQNEFQDIKFSNAINYNLHQINPSSHYRCLPHKVQGEGFCFKIIHKKGTLIRTPSKFKFDTFTKSNLKINISEYLPEHDHYTVIYFRSCYYIVRSIHANMINQIIASGITILQFGIPLGEMKGEDFIPAHGLSQSIYFNPQFSSLNLSSQDALQFLRANTVTTDLEIKTKWIIAKYKSANLGWLKNNQQKLKNYFPKNQRIINF